VFAILAQGVQVHPQGVQVHLLYTPLTAPVVILSERVSYLYAVIKDL